MPYQLCRVSGRKKGAVQSVRSKKGAVHQLRHVLRASLSLRDLSNAAYLGEARHYLGIDEDRIEDPRWRITCIPERVPLVAGFENQMRVANFSRKQSRPGDVRGRPPQRARRNALLAGVCNEI